MTNDPYRPDLDPARSDLRRIDGRYDKARGGGLVWIGALLVAIIVVGLFFAFNGRDNTGVATNTTPPTAQPMPMTPITPIPVPAPSTTGSAPAASDQTPAAPSTGQPPPRQY